MITPKPCLALSADADFEDRTWTFNPISSFGKGSVGAGRYAILREAEYLDLLGHCNELLAVLKAVLKVSDETGEDDEYSTVWQSAIGNMRAAIAKAEAN